MKDESYKYLALYKDKESYLKLLSEITRPLHGLERTNRELYINLLIILIIWIKHIHQFTNSMLNNQ